MSNPFYGEIRLFAGNFAPLGWAICDGSVLPIADYVPLFELLGTTYGGDGVQTFALPDLRGRVPMHQGNGHVLGEKAGQEAVSLTTAQLPVHRHPVVASGGGNTLPTAGLLGSPSADPIFTTGASDGTVKLASAANGSVGGGQPHDNLMPYTCVNYIISLFGIFPSQS